MLARMDHQSDASIPDDGDAARYEIRVKGSLSDLMLSAFPELQARTRNRVTVLTGAVPDQSALHGVLARIEALGLELLGVRRALSRPDPAADEDGGDAEGPRDATPPGDRSRAPGGGLRG
jgi:hypothetical protein